MLRANRVLIVDEDIADYDGSLLADFKDLGVDAELCSAGLARELLSEPKKPDAVIVRFPSDQVRADGDAMDRFVDRFKQSRDTGAIPLIAIGRPASGRTEQAADRFDMDIHEPVSAYHLIGRISLHGRIDAMHRELDRRRRAAAAFDCALPEIVAPAGDITDARLLYVGDPMNYLTIRAMLPASADLVGSFSASMAENYLDQQSFDLVLLNFDPAFAEDVIRTWRRHPQLAALPVVPVLNEIELESAAALFRAGASDILTRPITEPMIAERVEPLVRENRFRLALVEAYPKSRPDAIVDPVTGLFNKPFLQTYLDTALERPSLEESPMWLVGIHYAPKRASRRERPVADDGFRQAVSGMVRGLIRCEDLAATLSDDRIVIALGTRNRLAASIVARRLAAVVGMTPISGGKKHGPRYADLDVHFVKASADMTSDGIMSAIFCSRTLL